MTKTRRLTVHPARIIIGRLEFFPLLHLLLDLLQLLRFPALELKIPAGNGHEIRIGQRLQPHQAFLDKSLEAGIHLSLGCLKVSGNILVRDGIDLDQEQKDLRLQAAGVEYVWHINPQRIN